eukprot:TRINITY_DN25674_c0_g1_i1.p1 TRINITY_DN25674_c0_g1~~TRINITY_DN25674_c0_g1_i1.p1  ORF type:complete len:105 (+),score=20.74 TRINITY_DN25674_c0_g1_i1:97-411(+)
MLLKDRFQRIFCDDDNAAKSIDKETPSPNEFVREFFEFDVGHIGEFLEGQMKEVIVTFPTGREVPLIVVQIEGKLSHVLCVDTCLLYTSPSPRDRQKSRMPSSA